MLFPVARVWILSLYLVIPLATTCKIHILLSKLQHSLFLVHVLDTGSATIENLLNITFIGLGTFVKKSIQEKVNEFNFTLKFDGDPLITVIEPTAIIKCGNSSGFLFRNIISLSLINLTVLNCGVNVTDTLSYIQQTSPIDTINTLLHYVAFMSTVQIKEIMYTLGAMSCLF